MHKQIDHVFSLTSLVHQSWGHDGNMQSLRSYEVLLEEVRDEADDQLSKHVYQFKNLA